MAGAGDWLSAAGGLLGGATSFLGGNAEAKGYKAAAKGYNAAATSAQTNAVLSDASTRITLGQFARKTQQVLGGQRADIAQSGLKEAGSAYDVIRMSAQNASLDKALIQLKGNMDVNDWLAKSAGYTGQAEQATAQAKSSKSSGIGGLLGGVLKAASFLF